MVKFEFLAQFPVDHLSHPVMSSLILFTLIFNIDLCEWSLCLNHHISCTCYFISLLLSRQINPKKEIFPQKIYTIDTISIYRSKFSYIIHSIVSKNFLKYFFLTFSPHQIIHFNNYFCILLLFFICVLFYGISTILGYVMPDDFYTYK